jgi:signal transduction histidine kinase
MKTTAYRDYRRTLVLGCAAPIVPNALNWVIVAEQDQSEVFAGLNRMLYTMTLSVAVALVLILGVGRWLAIRMAQPLQTLVRVAHQVQAGNVGERVGPLPGPEAGMTGRVFNGMLDALEARQQELIRAAALGSVEELSSDVSRGLRESLAAIRRDLATLAGSPEARLENWEPLAAIEREVSGIERKLDGLVQYSSLESLHPIMTDFKTLALAAVARIQDLAKSRQVRVEIQDEVLKSRLRVDPDLLVRALGNLLANAIESSPVGGTVSLRARKAGLFSRTVFLEVTDSGPGLPSEAAELAFQPLFTTKPGRTGLGLTYARKIVEFHHGTLTVRSAEHGGAVFAIELPLDATA